jgi:hypothetical protein
MAVAGDGGRLLASIKAGQGVKAKVSNGIAPEELRPLQPQARADRAQGGRGQQQGQSSPLDKMCGCHRRGWRGRCVGCGGRGRKGGGAILMRRPELATLRPRVQLRTVGINRTHPVVLVPVHGHGFPLLPALHCGHVAAEVGRDFFPGIQPAFRRSRGGHCVWGYFAHGPLRSIPAITKPRATAL